MVEQEALAEQAPEPREQPVGFRRVARVDDIEATSGRGDPHRFHAGAQEAPRELHDEADGALGGDREPVAIDVDAFQPLEGRGVALRLRTDHADRVAGGGERGRFEPDPPVERDRQILDDDQDAAGLTSRCH